MNLKVIHICESEISGSPIRIVNALNDHTSIEATFISYHRARYFTGGLNWQTQKELCLHKLKEADIVHFHQYFDLNENIFGINFYEFLAKKTAKIRQYHGVPALCSSDGKMEDGRSISEDPLPQLVIAQYPERFFPRAHIVPNILPINDSLYLPSEEVIGNPVEIYYFPTTNTSAWSGDNGMRLPRFNSKGKPETFKMLQCLVNRLKYLQSVKIISQETLGQSNHEAAIYAKKRGGIAIDELVSGSYHLTSLESLSKGICTFGFLDDRTKTVLGKLTGATEFPWVNCKLEESDYFLEELILDEKLRLELGENARNWMEHYYSDKKMVNHYVRAYEQLLDDPKSFNQLRLEFKDPKVRWFVQLEGDLLYQSRKNAFGGTLKYQSSEALSEMEQVLLLQKNTPMQSWLLNNEYKRIDATSRVFNSVSRNWHFARYCFALPYLENARVLDLGCGTGYGCSLFAEKGKPQTVVGLDFDDLALEYARQHHCAENISYLHACASDTGQEESLFDVITCMSSLEIFEDDIAIVKEAARLLRAEGKFILSAQCAPISGMKFKRTYSHLSLIQLLAPYFNIVACYNQGPYGGVYSNELPLPGVETTTDLNKSQAESFLVICQKKNSLN